jgi:hypothetical protein
MLAGFLRAGVYVLGLFENLHKQASKESYKYWDLRSF